MHALFAMQMVGQILSYKFEGFQSHRLSSNSSYLSSQQTKKVRMAAQVPTEELEKLNGM